MTPGHSKQPATRILISYMVCALLFLTSFDLHIHAHHGKVSMDDTSAVHISSVAGEIASDDNADEININPHGLLKLNENSFSLIAVFLLITLVAAYCFFACVARLRDIHARLPRLPFHGTPTLRAPPLFNA